MKAKAIIFFVLVVILIGVVIASGIFLWERQETIDIEAQKIDAMLDSGIAGEDYVPGQVIVQYAESRVDMEENSGQAQVSRLSDKYELEEAESLPGENIQLVTVEGDLGDKMKEIIRDPAIESVQLNFIYKTLAINTNDPLRTDLWGLDNTGQVIKGIAGKVDADMDVPEAWGINEGTNAEIIVSVIDSGVDYNHPDLASSMWNGANCKDHEGRALGNCVHGYDFEDDDKTPLPASDEHGTHVAGIVAAHKNNNKGLVGIAPNAKIMAMRSPLTTVTNIKAINFSKHNGALIINASWGSTSIPNDSLLRDTIKNFPGLFVAAAGNSRNNHEEPNKAMYPCAYDFDNIICVAATDQNDNLADFSDYGEKTVDVGAPGKNIISTYVKFDRFIQDFDQVQVGGLPSGWTKTGNNNKWGVAVHPLWQKMLFAHSTGKPYDNNSNSLVTSEKMNLDTKSAAMAFFVYCDTQPQTSATQWHDYLEIKYSKDGNSFINAKNPLDMTSPIRISESYINYPSNSGGISTRYFLTSPLSIPEEVLTSNFKLGFNWVTDSTDNSYDGCAIDDIVITKYLQGEEYEFAQGTSMATPYTAGLAALVWGYKPTLTAAQVKSIILDTGDAIPALSGKTVAGKRINAHLAMVEAQNTASAPSNTPNATPTVTNTVQPSATISVTPSVTVRLSTTPISTTSPTAGSGSIICGAADTNNDGKFTIQDFNEFANFYNNTVRCSDASANYTPCGGKDVNRDGWINIVDFGTPGTGFAQRYAPKTSCALPS